MLRLRYMESSMTLYTGLVQTEIRLCWKEIVLNLFSCSFENFEFQNRIDFSPIAKRLMRGYRGLEGRYLDRNMSKVRLIFMLKIDVLTIHRKSF